MVGPTLCINRLVLFEQMSSQDGHVPEILDDEQMSNWVGIKNLPVKFCSKKPGTFYMKGIHRTSSIFGETSKFILLIVFLQSCMGT